MNNTIREVAKFGDFLLRSKLAFGEMLRSAEGGDEIKRNGCREARRRVAKKIHFR